MRSCDEVCPRLDLIRETGAQQTAEAKTPFGKVTARVQMGLSELACGMATSDCTVIRLSNENPDNPNPQCEKWAAEREASR